MFFIERFHEQNFKKICCWKCYRYRSKNESEPRFLFFRLIYHNSLLAELGGQTQLFLCGAQSSTTRTTWRWCSSAIPSTPSCSCTASWRPTSGPPTRTSFPAYSWRSGTGPPSSTSVRTKTYRTPDPHSFSLPDPDPGWNLKNNINKKRQRNDNNCDFTKAEQSLLSFSSTENSSEGYFLQIFLSWIQIRINKAAGPVSALRITAGSGS